MCVTWLPFEGQLSWTAPPGSCDEDGSDGRQSECAFPNPSKNRTSDVGLAQAVAQRAGGGTFAGCLLN